MARQTRARSLPLAVVTSAVVLLGCSDTPPASSDAGAPDAPSDDAGPPVECSFPDPIVAGTTETDALADAPHRCGQAAHRWLRDDSLGQLVDVQPLPRFSAAILESLVEGVGVRFPRPLQHDVALRGVTYRTQDRGVAIEASALVAYPEDLPRGEMRDVLLLLHGTSGFMDGCGVSGNSGLQTLAAAVAAMDGWVVVMPDYIGLKEGGTPTGFLHPYLVGQATAIASIDAVRAAARLMPGDRGEICLRPRVVTWGGSQGGHAALWVDRLMPYYGRELEHLGAVATVPPADLLGELGSGLSVSLNARSLYAAFLAATGEYYGLSGRMSEVLAAPFDVDVPAAIGAECAPTLFTGMEMASDIFAAPLLSAASMGTLGDYSEWGCFLAENGLTSTSIARLGGGLSSYGVLMLTGEMDELVNTPLERGSFTQLCTAGMPISYLECEGAGHGAAQTDGLFEIIDFIDARFAGEAFTPPTDCTPTAPVPCMGTAAP